MKKFIGEFKAFALRGNVLDMAAGVIIGSAFSGIVTSLTDNFINPLLNFVTAGRLYTLKEIAGFAAAFLSSVLNFLIMAFVLFCLLKAVNRVMGVRLTKKEPARMEPATKVCPFCKSGIAAAATRCPHCTSVLS